MKRDTKEVHDEEPKSSSGSLKKRRIIESEEDESTEEQDSMVVVTRSGHDEPVCMGTMTRYIEAIREIHFRLEEVDSYILAQKTVDSMKTKMSTSQVNELMARVAASMIRHSEQYLTMAARITIHNTHKNLCRLYDVPYLTDSGEAFVANNLRYETVVFRMWENHYGGSHSPLVSKEIYDFFRNEEDDDIVNRGKKLIESSVAMHQDFYQYDYFGYTTMIRKYANVDLNTGHLLEPPQHLLMTVSLGIHGVAKPKQIEHAIYTYRLMSQKFFTHATPTLLNSGRKVSQMASCFLVAMADDSLKAIFQAATRCALISQGGGGIGINVSNLRARGSPIKSFNGVAHGVCHELLGVFNSIARYVDQGGGKRKGAFAVYLEPWHADVEEFLSIRALKGSHELLCNDLHIGLWVPDLFMERVLLDREWSMFCPTDAPDLYTTHGDAFDEAYLRYEKEGKARKTISALKLWNQIVDKQQEVSEPYILFKDACNRKSNQKHLGTIRGSNLCVSGDTLVLTDNGHLPISFLEGKTVTVWNGEEWSEGVKIWKTGTGKNLIRVELSNGVHLDCTPEHEFYLQRSYHSKVPTKVQAKDLKEGDKLIKWNLPPVIEYEEKRNFPYAYTHGFFCGDGTTYPSYDKKRIYPKVSLYSDEKKVLLQHLDHESWTGGNKAGRIDVTLPKDLPTKFSIPHWSSVSDRLRWFEGYCDADGTIARNGTNESLQVGSIEKQFLLDVRLMLQTLGVEAKVTQSFGERKSLLPDGKGGHKEYDCKPLWRLLINSNGLYYLSQLGFSPKRLKFEERIPRRKAAHFVCVGSVDPLPESIQDTFCFTEPKRHMGMFNGILTGQCTEIIEYTDADEVAVCNLASVCLPAFLKHPGRFWDGSVKPFRAEKVIDWTNLESVIRQIVRNLDTAIDRMWYPIPEAKRSNLRHRPLGIGVQGLANVFGKLEIPFDSDQAKELNRLFFSRMYTYAISESTKLGKEKGSYPSYEGSPASEGLLQPDLWVREYAYKCKKYEKYDEPDTNLFVSSEAIDHIWREKLHSAGISGGVKLRNSLLFAPMPTASTAQIMGNQECFEPYTSNLYARATNAGDFLVINKELVESLRERGLWDAEMRNAILAAKGSIQSICRIPEHLRHVFRTVWEIKQSSILRMAAERGPYICQNQSLNLHLTFPTRSTLTSLHMLAWKMGLKGHYYIRRKAVVDPLSVNTISMHAEKKETKTSDPDHKEDTEIIRACLLDSKARGEDCEACGS